MPYLVCWPILGRWWSFRRDQTQDHRHMFLRRCPLHSLNDLLDRKVLRGMTWPSQVPYPHYLGMNRISFFILDPLANFISSVFWRKVRYWTTSARSGRCKPPVRFKIAEPGVSRERALSRYRRNRKAWILNQSTRTWTSWLRDRSREIRTRYLFSREVQLRVAMQPLDLPMLIRTP